MEIWQIILLIFGIIVILVAYTYDEEYNIRRNIDDTRYRCRKSELVYWERKLDTLLEKKRGKNDSRRQDI